VAVPEVDVARFREHGPVPEHAPLHPEKVFPLLGAAVSVTLDPCENVPEHFPLEQDKPPGLLVTVPFPLIEIESELSGPGMDLNTSKLGALSFPNSSYAVTEK